MQGKRREMGVCRGAAKIFAAGGTLRGIDREFVTSAKKFANFNEFSEIKKNRKNSYKIR